MIFNFNIKQYLYFFKQFKFCFNTCNTITNINSDTLDYMMIGIGMKKNNLEKNNIILNDSIESNKKNIEPKSKSNNWELFKLAWLLIPNKFKFITIILLIELSEFIKVYGLTTQNKLLVMSTPFVTILLCMYLEYFSFENLFKIKRHWKKITLNFFKNLNWLDKNNQTDMTDFNKMIDMAGSALYNISTWGIPTIIRGIFSFIQVIYILVSKGNWDIILISGIIYYIYFHYFMKYYQNKMSNKRQEMKKIEKKNIPVKKWILELFKENMKLPDDIINLENEFDCLENEFLNGYILVLHGMSLISSFISWIGLNQINNWEKFLLIKIVFDDLKKCIEGFSHFSNNLNMKSKDFDKYLEWYVNVGETKEKVPQYNIDESELVFTDINITYPKFSLKGNKLSLKLEQAILIRGQFGSGKTQLVNSLIGNIFSAKINKFNSDLTSDNFKDNWKYMSQMIRNKIPSGLSLREILEKESDDNLIFKLINVVGLQYKFANSFDFDIPIEGFSGGQLMLLSLIYFLWKFIKDKQKILVLDEPDQGLDSESKIRVIKSILNFLRCDIINWNGGFKVCVLVIYHGEDDEIVELLSENLFDKIWLFETDDYTSQVFEMNNSFELFNYCQNLLNKKQQKINKIKQSNIKWFENKNFI